MTAISNTDWECIYYHDELDKDNKVISSEWIHQIKYKHGYLILRAYTDNDKIYNESMIFIPKVKGYD